MDWMRRIEARRSQVILLLQGAVWLKQGLASGIVAPAAVAAYIVMVPVIGSVPSFGLFDGHRVIQLVVLGVATAPLLFNRTRARWLQTFLTLPALARVCFAGILGAGCVSAALAPFPRFAFLEVGLFVLLFVLMVTLAGQFQLDLARTNKLILILLSVGTLFYATSFGVGYVFSLTSELPVWPGAFNGFAHVRLFNQYQVWTLPLLVLPAVLLPVKQRGVRYGLHGMVALWYALLFASGGRGATLAMAGSMFLMLVLFQSRAFPWFRLQLSALGAGLILYGLLFVALADNLSVFSRLQEVTQDSGRFELWGITLDMIVRHPVLGEGPMQFARHLNEHAAHPHNAVLQWAAEWGLPSAFTLLGLAAWGFVAWVGGCKRAMTEEADSDRDLLLVAVTSSLVAAATYALVDGVIVMPLSQLLLAVFVGWAIALHAGDRPVVHSRHALGKAPQLLLIVIIVAWVAVGEGVRSDIAVLADRQADHVERTSPTLLHPRLWQQGFIEP